MSLIPTITLNNGMTMPQLGLGTWSLRGQACKNAIRAAQYGRRTAIRAAHLAVVFPFILFHSNLQKQKSRKNLQKNTESILRDKSLDKRLCTILASLPALIYKKLYHYGSLSALNP